MPAHDPCVRILRRLKDFKTQSFWAKTVAFSPANVQLIRRAALVILCLRNFEVPTKRYKRYLMLEEAKLAAARKWVAFFKTKLRVFSRKTPPLRMAAQTLTITCADVGLTEPSTSTKKGGDDDDNVFDSPEDKNSGPVSSNVFTQYCFTGGTKIESETAFIQATQTVDQMERSIALLKAKAPWKIDKQRLLLKFCGQPLHPRTNPSDLESTDVRDFTIQPDGTVVHNHELFAVSNLRWSKLDLFLETLSIVRDSLMQIIQTAISTKQYNVDRCLFEDVRMLFHSAVLVLFRFSFHRPFQPDTIHQDVRLCMYHMVGVGIEAISPKILRTAAEKQEAETKRSKLFGPTRAGQIMDDGFTELSRLVDLISKFMSPRGFALYIPDIRAVDQWTVARYIHGFSFITRDYSARKPFNNKDFWGHICARFGPKKDQHVTGMKKMAQQILGKDGFSAVPLLASIAAGFFMGMYPNCIPGMPKMGDIAWVLDCYANRENPKWENLMCLVGLNVDPVLHLFSSMAAKEYLNNLTIQYADGIRQISPGYPVYCKQVEDLCQRYRVMQNTGQMDPHLFDDMNECKSSMANYAAELRIPLFFWSMIDTKSAQAKALRRDLTLAKKDRVSATKQTAPSGTTRFANIARPQNPATLADPAARLSDAEAQGSPAQFLSTAPDSAQRRYSPLATVSRNSPSYSMRATIVESKINNGESTIYGEKLLLIENDILFTKAAQLADLISAPVITALESRIIRRFKIPEIQVRNFLSAWRFGVVIGTAFGLTAEQEHCMTSAMAAFYVHKRGHTSIEGLGNTACNSVPQLTYIASIWSKWTSVIGIPCTVTTQHKQDAKVRERVKHFTDGMYETHPNDSALLFCVRCFSTTTYTNYGGEICQKAFVDSILNPKEQIGFDETVTTFLDMKPVLAEDAKSPQIPPRCEIFCARTQIGVSEACLTTRLRRVSLLGRVVIKDGLMYTICPGCGMPMTISPFFTLFHPDFGPLCSYCCYVSGLAEKVPFFTESMRTSRFVRQE